MSSLRRQVKLTALDDALTIPLPPVQVVDLRQELRAGNRSIFSRSLHQALDDTLARGEQAILLLNRRGTASFVICRDCGHIETCPRCDLPLTYHQPRPRPGLPSMRPAGGRSRSAALHVALIAFVTLAWAPSALKNW